MPWTIENQSQFRVNVGRSNSGIWADAKNGLLPNPQSNQVTWSRKALSFEMFVFLDDGDSDIDFEADNVDQAVSIGVTTVGAVAAIAGIFLLLVPGGQPLGALMIASSVAVATAGAASSVVGVAQSVDEVMTSPAFLKNLPGSDDISFILTGGYEMGKLADGRMVAVGVDPLTVNWINNTRGTSGLKIADTWAPGQYRNTGTARPDRPLPRIPPKDTIARAPLSDGWTDCRAMVSLGACLYLAESDRLFRVHPNDGITYEIAAGVGDVVSMAACGSYLYVQKISNPTGVNDRYEIVKYSPTGTRATVPPTEMGKSPSERDPWPPHKWNSEVISISSTADLVVVNDGVLRTISPIGNISQVNGVGPNPESPIQPFGEIEGSEVGVFIKISPDAPEPAYVTYVEDVIDQPSSSTRLKDTEAATLLSYSRPYLYFVKEANGDPTDYGPSLWSAAIASDASTTETPVELFRWRAGVKVTHMTALNGSLFTLEDGRLMRTTIFKHDAPVVRDVVPGSRPPPR